MEAVLQEVIVKDVAYIGRLTDGPEDIYRILFGGIGSKYGGYNANDEILKKLMIDIVDIEDFLARIRIGGPPKTSLEESIISRNYWEEDTKTLLLFLKEMYAKMIQNKGTEIFITGEE